MQCICTTDMLPTAYFSTGYHSLKVILDVKGARFSKTTIHNVQDQKFYAMGYVSMEVACAEGCWVGTMLRLNSRSLMTCQSAHQSSP